MEDEPDTSSAISQSQAYWMPEAESSVLGDTTGMEPIEFEDQSGAFQTFEDEEADETLRSQNLGAVSGANYWPGSSMGAAGYAPVVPSSGFSGPPLALLPLGRSSDSILGGFGFGVNLSETYDSNVTQSSGVGGIPKSDDFITSLGGSLSYMSQARVWTFGGTYTGAYNWYANNTDFDGYSQSGIVTANYEGAKLSASLVLGVSSGRGGNRYYGLSSFVDQTYINGSIAARYVYSAKTVFTTNIDHSFTTADGPFSDTTYGSVGFAALYRYSPLTEIGPGIRFTRQNGGGSNTRISVGPTLNVNYRYSSKLSLTSQLGLNFDDYSKIGSSDASVSASIGLNYQASPLWGMDLTIFRDAQADPSVPNSFLETTDIRLGYHRKIRRADLGLGVSYTIGDAANPQVVGSLPDRDYYSIDGSIGMRIFKDTTSASIFVRYSDQISDRFNSFDSYQTGFLLSRSF